MASTAENPQTEDVIFNGVAERKKGRTSVEVRPLRPADYFDKWLIKMTVTSL